MKFISHPILLSLLACLFVHAPAQAEDMMDDTAKRDDVQAYHVYDDVDLIPAVYHQTSKNPAISIKSVYPQLESDSDKDGINQFNQLVNDMLESEVGDFKTQVMQTQSLQKNLPKSARKNNVDIDYDASAITGGDDDHIISVRFSIQGYMAGMAHPYHKHVVLNYNLDTGQKMELSDLFKANADYLTVLAETAREMLDKHLSNKEMVLEGTAPKPENYKIWNLKPSGLLITFDEARVAPYVNGPQTILIPYVKLQAILSPQSPLAKCIKRKKNCVKNNLLTGGFIDEA